MKKLIVFAALAMATVTAQAQQVKYTINGVSSDNGGKVYLIDKLSFATARIYDMCMGVAERREHRSPLCVDDFRVFVGHTCVVCRSEVFDTSVFHEQPGIVYTFQMSHFLSAKTFLLNRQYSCQCAP